MDWHCTASDTSVTVPSVPTVTTFTGTATVFPFSTAVFRISVSCDTHKTCLTDYIHQSLIGSVLPFFIYALIHSVCFFFISSVIHSLTVLLIPSLCSLSFPYYNCSFIGLVIPIFISFFFILTSLIHCWFVCSSLPFINHSFFHSSLLLSFFPFINLFFNSLLFTSHPPIIYSLVQSYASFIPIHSFFIDFIPLSIIYYFICSFLP